MKKVLFLRVYHCAPYMSQLGGSSGPEAGRSRKKARKNKKSEPIALADNDIREEPPATMKPLLDYHDAVVYPADLALLDSPTAWLNDACIHFHMARLQRTRRCGAPSSGEDGVDGDGASASDDDGGGGDGDDEGHRVRPLEDLYVDP